jgi:hypothetical protein
VNWKPWPGVGTDCADCGVTCSAIHEFPFMVWDELWISLFSCEQESTAKVLCVGCTEARLGRELVKADFNDALCNRSHWHSPRLMARLSS